MLPSFSMKKNYTITTFFKEVKTVTIEGVAEKANISSSLMRQYTCGTKRPSKERLFLIQNVIREMGSELAKIKIHAEIK